MLRDPNSDELAFDFGVILAVYAAWYFWHPDAIHLHTDDPDQIIRRARDGLSRKWSELILSMPRLQVMRAISPTHAGNGTNVKNHGAQNQTLSESKQFESWVVPILTLMYMPYET